MSLLVSTLETYFEGLAIAQLEQEWTQHPVLHVDFSGENYKDTKALGVTLNTTLLQWEKLYGQGEGEETYETRVKGIISRAREKTGRQVAVLVDEYDKTLLDTIPDDALLARNQDTLRGFYGALKAGAPRLRFVFLTGATRFAHVNIFSGLNNLRDISMSTAYAALRGITEAKLRTDLAERVARMAGAQGLSPARCYKKLKRRYDGYRSSPDGHGKRVRGEATASLQKGAAISAPHGPARCAYLALPTPRSSILEP